MKPYFQTDDGSIRIFHARWEDVLAAGVFASKDIALIHADPPYGIGDSLWGNKGGIVGAKRRGGRGKVREFVPFQGDGLGFDPKPLLALDRPSVLWGANHYANHLPGSPSWFFWDKREGQSSDHQSDGELAWSNLGGGLRTFGHYWRGSLRKSEQSHVHLHPTQKPEALSEFVFAHAEKRKKLKRGDMILIPYMGSFPDARPALVRGYKVIACEVAREYCDTAINARLRSVAQPVPHEDLGSLFARKNTP